MAGTATTPSLEEATTTPSSVKRALTTRTAGAVPTPAMPTPKSTVNPEPPARAISRAPLSHRRGRGWGGAAAALVLAVPLSAQPTVSGTILDPARRPIAGAQVELLPVPSNFEAGRLRL